MEQKSLSQMMGETQQAFVRVMNESNLPPEILELMLDNILKELRLLILQQENQPKEETNDGEK